jgi:hypothetical protein
MKTMPEDNGYGDWRDTAEEMRAEIERERYDMADWEPDGEDEWPCNDCGIAIPRGEDLCSICRHRLDVEEYWNALHPESRCPPRE